MKTTDNTKYSIGIDVGSSGIRLLLLNNWGDVFKKQLIAYETLRKQGYIIWDKEKRINVKLLVETIENQLFLLSNEVPEVIIKSLCISSIGPSLVLLSNEAQPLTHAFTYAYQGAQDYVKYLEADFQKRTGSIHSGALPWVQLLKIAETSLLSYCFKITTINDYLTWSMTDLPLKEIFSTVPNASYTGLYSLKTRNWDKKLIREIGLQESILPKIIPLGTPFPVKRELQQLSPFFKNTSVVAGTIDGINAFWATGVKDESIIFGSASTTGALRRWRKTPKTDFNSRLIQCCQVTESSWVEIIPFNNVGTSFDWLADNFNSLFKNYLNNTKQLNIEKLEFESANTLKEHREELETYLLKLPTYFPYIEGEPRGPNGRGKIRGGFIFKEDYQINCIDLYISLIIGITNMYQHNLETLDPPETCKEIRLTGLIARKSRLFLQILATLTNKKIVIMKTEQSVAWATGMRALTYIKELDKIPNVPTLAPILPQKGKIAKILFSLYRKYMGVYHSPDTYNVIFSEKELR